MDGRKDEDDESDSEWKQAGQEEDTRQLCVLDIVVTCIGNVLLLAGEWRSFVCGWLLFTRTHPPYIIIVCIYVMPVRRHVGTGWMVGG